MFYILIILLIIIGFFFLGKPPQAKEMTWGVNFSQKHAELLGLDWKSTYSALIDDLGAKNIKLATYWDLIEPENGKFYFLEINTIPGMTPTSLAPQSAQAAGIDFPELLERLIKLALEKN